MINIHASLLPKYRGAAPIAWAIYHGETETGVTIIKMSVYLDAGDMLAQGEANALSKAFSVDRFHTGHLIDEHGAAGVAH